MSDFETAMEKFIENVTTIKREYNKRFYSEMAKTREPLVETAGGRKFIRVASYEIHNPTGERTSNGVYCFVATTDGSNKKLGPYKAGDVFKPDGWAGPAKGARGNIFDEHGGISRMGPHGPAYNN